ncbi:MAG TPA: DegT/DnrJ/EryC1/StrS family aminotransferase [Solirubrobacteraceae bacterium]|nr:DegT/DnrJ/EryC1/StrS family aminotransferase [Solirubrobacteraceae bacterium]
MLGDVSLAESDRSKQAKSSPPAARAPIDPIPLARMDAADPALLTELMALVQKVAESGEFILGRAVEAFERDFAAYCEADHAVGVASGTDALTLAMRALDIGEGAEVIVPTNSFVATAEAVVLAGAIPRFVDVDARSGLVTAEGIKAAITPRTRCVIVVHLYGATVDLDSVRALAADAGLYLVEDACQAHGARYRGQRVGAIGDIGAFSFYPAKNLGAWGDGGAVVTNAARLAERVRLLRSHGERPRYRHRLIGCTGRLDAMQAAILRRKLAFLDRWNQERRDAAARLDSLLAGIDGVVTCSAAPDGGDHVFHLYVVRSAHRDALRRRLSEVGIESGIHYPTPIHQTEAFRRFHSSRHPLPVCEERAATICTLPLFPGITFSELERIAAAVRSASQDLMQPTV